MKKSLFLLTLMGMLAPCAKAIVSSTDDDAIYINEYIGATAFYEQGITGQNTVVANVELYSYDEDFAGFLGGDNYEWSGVEGASVRPGRHASKTLSIMAAYVENSTNEKMTTGIANGAYYYSAQVSDQTSGYGTAKEVIDAYTLYFNSNVDVISSSWANSSVSFDDARAGFVLDALAYDSPTTTFVAAAGNYGSSSSGNTYSPYINVSNSITVGALTSESDYTEVASYSSYGPSSFYNPLTGEIISDVVSAVDIVAPGDMIAGAMADDLSNTLYDAGTSFATPIVSGVVSLMNSYSKEYKMDESTLDTRLIKAVLLNSATKLAGWDNGQQVNADGVIVTTQSLDYTMGAGLVNAEQALTEYSHYDSTSFFDEVYFKSSLSYDFTVTEPGSILTATLCWLANTNASDITYTEDFNYYDDGIIVDIDLSSSIFADLDLEVWGYDENGKAYLLATSCSDYNAVEHLYLDLDEGDYFLRVLFDETAYGAVDSTYSEAFGIAWNLSTTVPEPSTTSLSLLALALLLRRRRRQMLHHTSI